MRHLHMLFRDRVTLVKVDGRRFSDLQAGVHPDHISVLDESGRLPAEVDDVVTRQLPNGSVEEWDVLEVTYFAANPLLHTPSRFKLNVRKRGSRRPQPNAPGDTYNIYNVSGVGSRVNINSEDYSHNVVTVTPGELFEEIRRVIDDQVKEAELRGQVVARLNALEKAHGKKTFGALYVQFVGFLADHAALLVILGPHLPGLAQLATR